MSRPGPGARLGDGRRMSVLVAVAVVAGALGVGAAVGGNRALRASTRASLASAHVLAWTDVWSPTVQSRTADGATLSVALGMTLTSGPPLTLHRLRLPEGEVRLPGGGVRLAPGQPTRLRATFVVRCPASSPGAPTPHAGEAVWADASLPDGTARTLPTWIQDGSWTLPDVARTTCGVSADGPPVAVWTMDATPRGALRLALVGHGETFDLALADPADPEQSAWTWRSEPALPLAVPEGQVVAVTITLVHRGCPSAGDSLPAPPRLVPVTDGRERTGRYARYPDGWSDAAVAAAAAAAVVRDCP